MRREFEMDQQGSHLTEEEFGELMEAGSAQPVSQDDGAARAHVDACTECAAELASLRAALALFRETTSAYASEQLAGVPRRTMPRASVGRRFSPGLLWTAAGLLVGAGVLPLKVQHQRAGNEANSVTTHSPASKQLSDEALLDAVNIELSALVPAAMQPLADPSGTMNETTETQPSTKRKN
ncbi:MAG: hypothetical protein NVSMB62_21870 [Acidobacteriaceae bacterium]